MIEIVSIRFLANITLERKCRGVFWLIFFLTFRSQSESSILHENMLIMIFFHSRFCHKWILNFWTTRWWKTWPPTQELSFYKRYKTELFSNRILCGSTDIRVSKTFTVFSHLPMFYHLFNIHTSPCRKSYMLLTARKCLFYMESYLEHKNICF